MVSGTTGQRCCECPDCRSSEYRMAPNLIFSNPNRLRSGVLPAEHRERDGDEVEFVVSARAVPELPRSGRAPEHPGTTLHDEFDEAIQQQTCGVEDSRLEELRALS